MTSNIKFSLYFPILLGNNPVSEWHSERNTACFNLCVKINALCNLCFPKFDTKYIQYEFFAIIFRNNTNTFIDILRFIL